MHGEEISNSSRVDTDQVDNSLSRAEYGLILLLVLLVLVILVVVLFGFSVGIAVLLGSLDILTAKRLFKDKSGELGRHGDTHADNGVPVQVAVKPLLTDATESEAHDMKPEIRKLSLVRGGLLELLNEPEEDEVGNHTDGNTEDGTDPLESEAPAVGANKIAKESIAEPEGLPSLDQTLGARRTGGARNICLLQVTLLATKVKNRAAPTPGIAAESVDAEVGVNRLIIVEDVGSAGNKSRGDGEKASGDESADSENEGDVVLEREVGADGVCLCDADDDVDNGGEKDADTNIVDLDGGVMDAHACSLEQNENLGARDGAKVSRMIGGEAEARAILCLIDNWHGMEPFGGLTRVVTEGGYSPRHQW